VASENVHTYTSEARLLSETRKSKPRIFICIQLYLLSQLEVLETKGAC